MNVLNLEAKTKILKNWLVILFGLFLVSCTSKKCGINYENNIPSATRQKSTEISPTVINTPTITSTITPQFIQQEELSGRLFFYMYHDIYYYDLSTMELIRITNDEADDYAPSASSDGKQVVFLSNRKLPIERQYHYGLFIMNVPKTDIDSAVENNPQPIQLVYPAGVDIWNPSWSYDDQWIAYADRHDTTSNICVISPDGKYGEKIYSKYDQNQSYAWMSDSNTLAIVGLDNELSDYASAIQITTIDDIFTGVPPKTAVNIYQQISKYGKITANRNGIVFENIIDDTLAIYIMKSGEHKSTPIYLSTTETAYHPVWSPDGKWIAFYTWEKEEDKRNLCLYDYYRENVYILEEDINQSGIASSALVWSRDSEYIALPRHNEEKESFIYIIKLEESNLVLDNGNIPSITIGPIGGYIHLLETWSN